MRGTHVGRLRPLDLVLDMETDDLPALSNTVVQEIRPIPGVLSTETLVTTSI